MAQKMAPLPSDDKLLDTHRPIYENPGVRRICDWACSNTQSPPTDEEAVSRLVKGDDEARWLSRVEEALKG